MGFIISNRPTVLLDHHIPLSYAIITDKAVSVWTNLICGSTSYKVLPEQQRLPLRISQTLHKKTSSSNTSKTPIAPNLLLVGLLYNFCLHFYIDLAKKCIERGFLMRVKLKYCSLIC